MPVNLKSAEDRPNSLSARHLYVPSVESVICGICKEKEFLRSLFRVRLGSVVRSLCGALNHLIRGGGMAGAKQNSVTTRVEGEGVHLACILAVGGSVRQNLKCFEKYFGTLVHHFKSIFTFKTKS